MIDSSPSRPLQRTAAPTFAVFVRLAADAVLVAIPLFISAGTLSWWRAWVLLAVLLSVRTVSAIVVHRVNPTLVQERARLPVHGDQSGTDKALLLTVLGLGFMGVPIIAGLDVFHWHLLPRPAPFPACLGLVFFALGWGVKGVALWTNAFATTAVRLQHDRRHAVVNTGIYGRIRHPFYAGTTLVITGQGLWLGSYAAVLFAFIPFTFLVVRIRLEEQFLRRELPGYDDYMRRVPYRLLPGIW